MATLQKQKGDYFCAVQVSNSVIHADHAKKL
jgi:hypothetical protein